MGNKNKEKKDKENLKSKAKRKKINLPLYLSVIAILISLGQLIFTIPVVLKYFEKVELKVIEYELAKKKDDDFVRTSFLIVNTGKNTARNVELHLRLLKDDKILFVPEVFNLVKDDTKGGIAKNIIYECDEIVPGEKVRFFVFSKSSSSDLIL